MRRLGYWNNELMPLPPSHTPVANVLCTDYIPVYCIKAVAVRVPVNNPDVMHRRQKGNIENNFTFCQPVSTSGH